MNKMKTLTIQGVQFEVVDEQARNDIEVLKENGGASSWNDLKDKPFGAEKAFEPITWDGNTEGKEFFVDMYIKIFDEYIPITNAAQVTGIILKSVVDGVEQEEFLPINRFEVRVAEHGWALSDFVICSDGQYEPTSGMVVPKGLWAIDFRQMGVQDFAGLTILPGEKVITIDRKFIPSNTVGILIEGKNIHGDGTYTLSPEGANVEDLKKAVDAGRPPELYRYDAISNRHFYYQLNGISYDSAGYMHYDFISTGMSFNRDESMDYLEIRRCSLDVSGVGVMSGFCNELMYRIPLDDSNLVRS